MIRRLENFIVRNWIWMIIGIVLTRKCIELAYQERGYVAIGGEYLVLPILLMVVHLVRDMADQYKNLMAMEDDDE